MATSNEGSSRVTIYDVATEAGVSSATVSRVLAGLDTVAETTRAHVLDVAERMGYRPNQIARSLSKRSSDMVAVMLPDITNPFFSELVKGVQSAAFRQGLTTLICNTESDPALERRYLDGLLASQVSYILVVGLTLDNDTVQDYAEAGLTFIALDRPLLNSSPVLVQSDNRGGGALAVHHLIELDHRRIAHIAGPGDVALSADRLQGYRDALRAAEIEIDDALLVESDFSEQGGARAFEELDRRGGDFTAVFAADDLIAMGALSAAVQSGRSVPRDLSLVGFDDVLYARFTSPPLTTVRQDAMAMGERAVRVIVTPAAERPTGTVVLPVSLVIRGSTGRAGRRGRGRRR
jgi:LacI family transcriptional regulator